MPVPNTQEIYTWTNGFCCMPFKFSVRLKLKLRVCLSRRPIQRESACWIRHFVDHRPGSSAKHQTGHNTNQRTEQPSTKVGGTRGIINVTIHCATRKKPTQARADQHTNQRTPRYAFDA